MKPKLNLLIIVRSLLFWPIASLALPTYSLIALIVMPLKARVRHQIMISATYYFAVLFKYIAGISYTVKGLNNIPSSPAIFAGNHQSAWETAILNCFLPPCVWIMKKEILNIPFYGWGVRAMSTIAIDRSRGDSAMLQVIEEGKKRFLSGFWIIMFPEGTRVKPKVRKPFKQGSAKLALNLNVPIIPFAHNAGNYFPKKSFWLYPGTITVVIGEPIYPDNDDAVDFTRKVEAWVYRQLEQMDS